MRTNAATISPWCRTASNVASTVSSVVEADMDFPELGRLA